MVADSRRPRRPTPLGPTSVRANANASDQQWALYVVQEGTAGPAGALRVESLSPDAVASIVGRPRKSDGTEGEDIWQVQYEGRRGAYANGYGCLRGRVPNHADAANQVALRCQCHSSKDGTSQAIFEATLSDNTTMFQVRANGEYRAPAPRWLNATLGTNIVAGDGSTPGTSREGARIFFRGQPAWAAATIGASSVILTVDTEHRPATRKAFSVRTSPTSNIACVLELATNGQLTNLTSFGSSTTAYVPLDGLSYDLS